MINGKRIAVVMPAYNAEKTLEKTVRELSDVVDIKILVDDSCKDQTAAALPQARRADVCPRRQLRIRPQSADLLSRSSRRRRRHRCHGSSRLSVHAPARSRHGRHDRQRRLRHGSRLAHSRRRRAQGRHALLQISSVNRLLTAFQNLFLGVKLSEYHTGFRAFSRELLETLPLLENSDDFVFDNQMIAQAVMFGFNIGEISCPTKYFEEASSINFKRSVEYGLGVLATTVRFVAHKVGLIHSPAFGVTGRKVTSEYYRQIPQSSKAA